MTIGRLNDFDPTNFEDARRVNPCTDLVLLKQQVPRDDVLATSESYDS